MENLLDHGVDYSSVDVNLELRELLRLSQTNVTADNDLGLKYAAAAFDKGLNQTEDTTAAGEAAAKAELRAAQTGKYEPADVYRWFDRSNEVMPKDARGQRELAATNQLDGRARSIFIGRSILENGSADKDEVEAAQQSFERAIRLARDPRDPYTTMTYRHYATLEAMVNKPLSGFFIAFAGVGKAITARREAANQQPNTSTKTKAVQHAKFITKQTLYNSVAGALSLASPLSKIPKLGRLHTKFALKMLS